MQTHKFLFIKLKLTEFRSFFPFFSRLDIDIAHNKIPILSRISCGTNEKIFCFFFLLFQTQFMKTLSTINGWQANVIRSNSTTQTHTHTYTNANEFYSSFSFVFVKVRGEHRDMKFLCTKFHLQHEIFHFLSSIFFQFI